MTDETQTSVTGATVTPEPTTALGRIAHEAAVLAGQAEGEFDALTTEAQADLQAFAKVVEAVVVYVLANQVPAPSAPTAD